MWWFAPFILLLGCSFLVTSDRELPLNSQATYRNEVKSIHHSEASHRVVIALAENRTCVKPTFMVRLSGASLYLLDLMPSSNHSRSHVVFRYPPQYDTGLYFLEVLMVYCETLDPNNFVNMCIVNPQHGKSVLTLPYSFVVKVREQYAHPRPRWVLRVNHTSVLLSTRYQKVGTVASAQLGSAPHPALPACVGMSACRYDAPEVAQHNLYEWTDKPAYLTLINQTLEWGRASISHPTYNETISICMVGASHASLIAHWGNHQNISGVNFVSIPNRYPQFFDARLLVNCTYAVLAYGQWPLSGWTGNTTYTAKRYEPLMRRVLEQVVAANLSTQVFLRSINLNALGSRYTTCPPKDRRHPPIVMMYNALLNRLSAEYGVPFIDLFPVQGPLWDIALDWSHPHGRVGIAEAEYVLHSVLAYSHKHRRAPSLELDFASRVRISFFPTRVQFTDSDIVYVLIVNNTLRALPNAESMQHLGFNAHVHRLHPITVVNATQRSEYVIGPLLPDI